MGEQLVEVWEVWEVICGEWGFWEALAWLGKREVVWHCNWEVEQVDGVLAVALLTALAEAWEWLW